MQRFREFVDIKSFNIRLREGESIPTAPTNPDSSSGGGTTNKYHFDKLQDELDIDDESFTNVIENGVQTLYKVPDYGWGFRVQPPIQATVEDMCNEQYKVTFLLNQANKRKMFLPYKQGERPVYYEGLVENKTVMMNKEELSDLIVPPYENVASGGMGMPPMGGAPGTPPVGNPLSGGIPPMGGM